MPWAEREESWYRTDVQYCEVTGQLLPRRYWEFEHNSGVIKARDPHCEELFRAYVLRNSIVSETLSSAAHIDDELPNE